MAVQFRAFERSHAEELARWMAGHVWPFHARARLETSDVLAEIEAGALDSEETRTFWITDGDQVVGVVRLFDLDDGAPLFDLRLAGEHRGRGIGTEAVRWLTAHVFDNEPSVTRLEATTRVDNVAMGRALRRCGYVKESHWRATWPDFNGGMHDGVGYSVLRSDWQDDTRTPVAWTDEEAAE